MLGVIKLNGYNYDYFGMNDMIPGSGFEFIGDYSQNIMNNPSVNYKNSLLDPTEGFVRGNIFGNLYNSYKNYKPNNLNPKNEKEAMLWSFLQYNFTLKDLGLYLDIYPNDSNVLNIYKQYLNIYKDIKNEYEKKYGPLTCNSMYAINGEWKWNNSPWPWEVI